MGFKAAEAEENGDLERASRAWQDLRGQAGRTMWGLLAKYHLRLIDSIRNYDRVGEDHCKYINQFGKDPPDLEEPARDALEAYRCEHFADAYKGTNDFAMAKRRWEDMKEKYRKEADQRYWFMLAAQRANALKENIPPEPDAIRKKALQQGLDQARNWLDEKNRNLRRARELCLHLLAIYRDEKPFAKEIDEISRALAKVNEEMNK